MTAPSENFSALASRWDGSSLADLEHLTVNTPVTEIDALIHADPRPLAVRLSTLATVVQALDCGDVPYIMVPGFNDHGSVLAVHEDSRTALGKALRTCANVAPARVRQLHPRPTVVQSDLRTNQPTFLRTLQTADVLRLWWDITDPDGSILFGQPYGVEIEIWKTDRWREGVHTHAGMDDDDRRSRHLGPRPNRSSRILLSPYGGQEFDANDFSRLYAPAGTSGLSVKSADQLVKMTPDVVRFPIDVVYTWVDSDDPAWQQRRDDSLHDRPRHAESASVSRFINRDELRYSLRSLYANAPWVNQVYIVTDQQRPPWLLDVPGVTVVDHREIFTDVSVLPVYNSHAIEANLHRIPGLSEHFLYFNDDMFIGRPVTPNTFFHPNGIAKHFPSPSRVPFTPPGQHDTPVDSATKNVRELMRERWQVDISQVMEHAPYALRRSVLEEMESRHEDAFARTSAARTRSESDLNIPSNFAHHYGFQRGSSLPASLAFAYVGLSVRDLENRLGRLLARRDRDAFCLNDTFSDNADVESQLELVLPFLDRYFPVASPWEMAE